MLEINFLYFIFEQNNGEAVADLRDEFFIQII
jgi:hypothetical protein